MKSLTPLAIAAINITEIIVMNSFYTVVVLWLAYALYRDSQN